MNELTVFAKNMEAQRKRLKLYQKDIAEKTGLTKAAISSYEKGTKLPNLENAIKIANALNTSLDDLCGMKNRATEIQTYADVLTLLMDVVGITEASLWCDEKCISEEHDLYDIVSTITIHNRTISRFVEDWEKVWNLYLSNTIDEEIYDAWRMKKLHDYGEIPFYDDEGDVNDPNSPYQKMASWDEGEDNAQHNET